MGDYYRPLGVRTALVGKTHMTADIEGMQRLGVDPKSIIGVRVSECGFDPYERDDGLHGRGPGRRLRQGPTAALQQISQRQGLSRRQPLARLGQCRAGRRQQARVRLGDAPRAQACAREGRRFRDALHDAARHRFHPRGGRRRRGACICPTSSRTGPISRRRPTTTMYSRSRCHSGGALGRGAQESASGVRAVHGAARQQDRSRATKCARRSSRSTWG